MTDNQTPCFAGIDVGKFYLDIALHPLKKSQWFTNDGDGILRLAEWLTAHGPLLVVAEATGGYERDVCYHLKQAGFIVSVVNPAQTAAFRAMKNKIAKADALDAQLIADFAALVQSEAGGVLTEDQQHLKDLTARRKQVVTYLAEEKTRLQTSHDADVIKSIQETINLFKKERKRIEALVLESLKKQADLQRKHELLQTISSIGKVVSMTLVTEIPELGTLPPKEIASLTGLAPHNRDSGKRQGHRSIKGGRTCVQAALYMAAVTAARHNRPLRPLTRG